MRHKQIASTDQFNGHFAEVKAGDTITLIDGFYPRTGKAYGKKIDRWGRSIRVKLEDGRFDWISSFTTVGIGAYWTPDSPLRGKEN